MKKWKRKKTHSSWIKSPGKKDYCGEITMKEKKKTGKKSEKRIVYKFRPQNLLPNPTLFKICVKSCKIVMDDPKPV